MYQMAIHLWLNPNSSIPNPIEIKDKIDEKLLTDFDFFEKDTEMLRYLLDLIPNLRDEQENTAEKFEKYKNRRNEYENQLNTFIEFLNDDDRITYDSDKIEERFMHRGMTTECKKKESGAYFVNKGDLLKMMKKDTNWEQQFFMKLIDVIRNIRGTKEEIQEIETKSIRDDSYKTDYTFDKRLGNFISNLYEIIGECAKTAAIEKSLIRRKPTYALGAANNEAEEYVNPYQAQVNDSSASTGTSGGRKTKRRKTMKKRRKTHRRKKTKKHIIRRRKSATK